MAQIFLYLCFTFEILWFWAVYILIDYKVCGLEKQTHGEWIVLLRLLSLIWNWLLRPNRDFICWDLFNYKGELLLRSFLCQPSSYRHPHFPNYHHHHWDHHLIIIIFITKALCFICSGWMVGSCITSAPTSLGLQAKSNDDHNYDNWWPWQPWGSA